MSEQILFGTNDFAINPEPRLPCVLLLDISGSMAGTPIAELNDGLIAYRDALVTDALAARRVEVAIVTFGGQVQTVCDFTTVEGFHPPTLAASGDTPMGRDHHRIGVIPCPEENLQGQWGQLLPPLGLLAYGRRTD
jgi:hypothetical protein